MKNHFLLFVLMLSAALTSAQTGQSDVDMAEHKIIFQLTSADTNVHKVMVKQLGNLLAAAPHSRMEIVCHGPGLDVLRVNHTIVYPKIKELHAKGVQFIACENTLRERKISKEEIIPESGFVKAGILEIVNKQEEGWSYIRVAQ